jgi:hypothetical protein
MTSGYALGQDGGGVYVLGEGVLRGVTVRDNTTSASGGGISVAGSLRGLLCLENSVVTGNAASPGGGISSIGGIVLVERSTISGNTGFAGGINNNVSASTALNNVTVTGNRARGGLVNEFGQSGEQVNVSNSIIAGNTGPSGEPLDCAGRIISRGYNLIQAPGSQFGRCVLVGNLAGNLIGVAPKLGPLKNNGGPTPTHALLPGSPAISA